VIAPGKDKHVNRSSASRPLALCEDRVPDPVRPTKKQEPSITKVPALTTSRHTEPLHTKRAKGTFRDAVESLRRL